MFTIVSILVLSTLIPFLLNRCPRYVTFFAAKDAFQMLEMCKYDVISVPQDVFPFHFFEGD